MTQNEFKNLLYNIGFNPVESFSGIGIIICESTSDLPIVSLRDDYPNIKGSSTHVLSEISSLKSNYHDGFHIVNEKGELTHVAQYFSPPIVDEKLIDKSRLVGGRFIAALFGSVLQDVIMTGIVSKDRKASIFVDGKEVYFEDYS
jgi:hypothetical protein|tara:strand:- start:676 stop:1110 length:435 start_codon:yes stop_codon:yes gene_type:complete